MFTPSIAIGITVVCCDYTQGAYLGQQLGWPEPPFVAAAEGCSASVLGRLSQALPQLKLPCLQQIGLCILLLSLYTHVKISSHVQYLRTGWAVLVSSQLVYSVSADTYICVYAYRCT